MDNKAKMFSVCLWDTHPDLGEDTCCTGEDFATEAEARECIANLENFFGPVCLRTSPYVELDGPEIHEVIERPGMVEARKRHLKDDLFSERRENAMMAGMAFGCDGYNDVMGY